MPPSRLQRLTHRLGERSHYARTRDWLWSLYGRLTVKRALRFLPFRGQLHPLRMRGVAQPLYIRLGSSDQVVVDEIFIDGEYEPVLKQLPDTVREVVDLGANAGYSVRLWQSRFPGAKVIAVEPHPDNLRACRRNIAAGPAPQDVTLIEACAAGRPRRVNLDGEGWAASLHDTAGNGTVDALTIPQILERGNVSGVVDLLKMDIEGAEREVFADCRVWLDRVRTMVVELHHPYRVEDFQKDLERNGGDFELLDSRVKPEQSLAVARNRRV